MAKLPNMPLIQSAWVVADMEASMKGWLALGVGPFFTFEIDAPDALYRGERVPLRFRGALAQADDIQIEVIEQLSDGPSAYRDGVPKGQSGFHHVCRAFGAYDETLARLRGLGLTAATEVSFGPTRFAYVDTREMIGCMLELVDNGPTQKAITALVRDGARTWDGSDPVRPIDFSALFPSG
jgi:hypothetical protein